MRCSRVAAIATNLTGPTSLLNKGLLHLPTPLHHRLRATSLAAVIAPSVSAERRLAMPPTHQQHEPRIKLPCEAHRRRRPAPSGGMRLQSIAGQPMPHRCLTAVHRIRDLRYRNAGLNERLELLARQPPARGGSISVDRLWPVPLRPVGDRRFVQPRRLPISASDKSCPRGCSRGARSMPQIVPAAWDGTHERTFSLTGAPLAPIPPRARSLRAPPPGRGRTRS